MKSMKDNKDNDMLKEFDFREGESGKYAKAYQEGGDIVVLKAENEHYRKL